MVLSRPAPFTVTPVATARLRELVKEYVPAPKAMVDPVVADANAAAMSLSLAPALKDLQEPLAPSQGEELPQAARSDTESSSASFVMGFPSWKGGHYRSGLERSLMSRKPQASAA